MGSLYRVTSVERQLRLRTVHESARNDCGTPQDKAVGSNEYSHCRIPNVVGISTGKLFCGTLPSGHVMSLEAGKSVTYDRALSPGWHHLVAVRDTGRLQLYIDGNRVAESDAFDPSQYHLSTDGPLKIGFGQHDYFNGRMKDLRIYSRALSADDIEEVQAVAK